MITIEEADRILRDAILPGSCVSLPLAECAGRVLREPVLAERAAPPFDRAMMDGFAIRAADGLSHLEGLPICGSLAAGQAPALIGSSPAAMEIMTGAVVPANADCIVPVEDCETMGSLVRIPGSACASGRFIDREGSDHAAGSVVLRAGLRLGATELAVAATEGCAELIVNDTLAIHVITTGDEVVPVGEIPQPWQIRGSHATALSAMLSAPDVGVTAEHVPDDPDQLRDAIQTAQPRRTWLCLCGGASKGGKDHVIDVLRSLGAEIHFHRVAQRPGHPMAFATLEGIPVFCLPGNPLSVLCSARRHLAPAIQRHRGQTRGLSPIPIVFAEPIKASPDSTRFLPVLFQDGIAIPAPFRNSGSLHTLAGTSGFVEVPSSHEPHPAGTAFAFHNWQP